MITFSWHSHSFTLLPERIVVWASRRTLIAADPHFGKAEAFRGAGVFIPGGTTEATLARLSAAIERTRALRLIILGDLLHAIESQNQDLFDTMRAWHDHHPSLEIVNVRGNHDRRAGDPPEDLRIACVDSGWRDAKFAFTHEPVDRLDAPTFAGHIHPRIGVRDIDGTSLRAPCFWFGERRAIVPALGAFTGTTLIRPNPGDRVFAVLPESVVDVSRTLISPSPVRTRRLKSTS